MYYINHFCNSSYTAADFDYALEAMGPRMKNKLIVKLWQR